MTNRVFHLLVDAGSTDDDLASDEDYEGESDIECDFGFECNVEILESEEEDSVDDWSNEKIKCNILPFSNTTGLKVEDIKANEAMDYFDIIFTDNFLTDLLRNMNDQALKLFQLKDPAFARMTKLKPFTMNDLRVFLALYLHMGIIQMHGMSDYWNKGEKFGLNFFTKHMARNLFLRMWRCIDFDPKVKVGDFDKLTELINSFNNNMAIAYLPDKVLCIDKSQAVWKETSIRCKNKSREMVNIYLLSDENGYVLKIYAGTEKQEVDKIAKTLLAERLGVGHAVYIENPSLKLAKHLVLNNTHVTGILSLKQNDLPTTLNDVTLNPNEKLTLYSKQGICATKWQGRQTVMGLSTEHDDSCQSYTTKTGSKYKPKLLLEYDKHMTGIEKHHHFVSYYGAVYKNKKIQWHKKLGLHILNIMFCNAYILYNKSSIKPHAIQDFRLALIDALVSNNKNVKFIPVAESFTLHTPYKLPRDPKSNRIKRKRCVYCWTTTNKRIDTASYCPKCPNAPGLCQGKCFEEFHAMHNLT
ncbi:uncharacterized protein LOC134749294 [Cydia strobilella]|uniref:uncharacterized protein LOC134749294 n=1 Tax=Cydia strobilella TaxID=1100964 RepID=UPI003004E2CA